MLFFTIFNIMKKAKSNTANIAISNETHSALVSYVQSVDGKIGKFVEKAIKEKIDRERPKQAS